MTKIKTVWKMKVNSYNCDSRVIALKVKKLEQVKSHTITYFSDSKHCIAI